MLVQAAAGGQTTALKKNLENEIEAELGALDWSVAQSRPASRTAATKRG